MSYCDTCAMPWCNPNCPHGGEDEDEDDTSTHPYNVEDLLIEFDELGMAPTTLVSNPEKTALEWKQKLIKATKESDTDTKELVKVLHDRTDDFCPSHISLCERLQRLLDYPCEVDYDNEQLKASNDRLKILLYNAIVFMEEELYPEILERELGITQDEYSDIMKSSAVEITPKRKTEVEDLFVEIAEQHEDCEIIVNLVRSLNTEGIITDEEYDYLTTNWDVILQKHGLL